jgi:hypothetical protein
MQKKGLMASHVHVTLKKKVHHVRVTGVCLCPLLSLHTVWCGDMTLSEFQHESQTRATTTGRSKLHSISLLQPVTVRSNLHIAVVAVPHSCFTSWLVLYVACDETGANPIK